MGGLDAIVVQLIPSGEPSMVFAVGVVANRNQVIPCRKGAPPGDNESYGCAHSGWDGGSVEPPKGKQLTIESSVLAASPHPILSAPGSSVYCEISKITAPTPNTFQSQRVAPYPSCPISVNPHADSIRSAFPEEYVTIPRLPHLPCELPPKLSNVIAGCPSGHNGVETKQAGAGASGGIAASSGTSGEWPHAT